MYDVWRNGSYFKGYPTKKLACDCARALVKVFGSFSEMYVEVRLKDRVVAVYGKRDNSPF